MGCAIFITALVPKRKEYLPGANGCCSPTVDELDEFDVFLVSLCPIPISRMNTAAASRGGGEERRVVVMVDDSRLIFRASTSTSTSS